MEVIADPAPGELEGEFEVGLDVEFEEEPAEEAELALAPAVPSEVAEVPEIDESTTREPVPLAPPLHPQPQRATVMSTKKSRKNGELCG